MHSLSENTKSILSKDVLFIKIDNSHVVQTVKWVSLFSQTLKPQSVSETKCFNKWSVFVLSSAKAQSSDCQNVIKRFRLNIVAMFIMVELYVS